MPSDQPDRQLIEAREVPLGGLRALTVRRTLPSRDRSFVGAWCFVDHYGPTPVGTGNDGGMDVPPHPHTGLQTVSWLFEGEIEHRDSGGVVGLVRPGEVNLMTAGAGIAHSEVSTAATTTLHGVQLWVALPDSARHVGRGFEHHAPPVTALPGGGRVRVFIGAIKGLGESPIHTHTPLLGAQLDLVAGETADVPVDPAYEHAVLLDAGDLTVAGTPVAQGDLLCLERGRERLTLASTSGARLILLGGTPFAEEIVMWWNFVGRSHEEIVEFRERWQGASRTFGHVEGYLATSGVHRLPAPPIPAVRLRPRGRRGRQR